MTTKERMFYIQKLPHECGVHAYHNEYKYPAIMSYTETYRHTHIRSDQGKNKKPFFLSGSSCVNPYKTQF